VEIILLVGLALLSSLWSYKPASTLIRSVGLLGPTVVAVYIVYRYTMDEMLTIFWVASALMLVASIIAILFFPEYGILRDEWSVGTNYEAAWRGIFHNKNSFATVMLLGAMTFLYCAVMFKSWPVYRRYANYVFLLLSVGMLLAAHSVSVYVTAVSVCLGIASLVLIARNGLMRLPLTLLSIWFAALVIVVFVSDPAMVTTVLGRDPTLTKRTVIWAFALQMIEARPLLGYGYGVFWDSVGSVARVVNAHNGYLTVILDLGVLGAILLFALLARVSWQCCSVVMTSPVFAATWPAAVLLGLMVNNLTEAELFSPNGVQWCLLIIVAGICEKARRQALLTPGTRQAFGPRPVGV
jgi:O-antigen ligase